MQIEKKTYAAKILYIQVYVISVNILTKTAHSLETAKRIQFQRIKC